MALGENNIYTALVKNEINSSSNNLGNLCTDDNINIWSKKKPVIDTRITIPFADVGKGSNGMYGLEFKAYSGDDTLLTIYNKPTGGSSSPYRLGDFRGYEHNAVSPIIIQNKPTNLQRREQTLVSFATIQGGSSIAIGDLYGTLRLGVRVYNSSGGLLGSASAKDAGGTSVNIDLTGILNTTVTVKFCLVDYYKEWGVGGGLTANYEIPRQFTTENKNWVDVPLVNYTPPTAVKQFDVTWNPIKDEIEANVKTNTYTGTASIQLVPTTGSSGGYINFTITAADTLQTIINSSLLIVAGMSYDCHLRFSDQLIRASTTFVAFDEI